MEERWLPTDENVIRSWIQILQGAIQLERVATLLAVHGGERGMVMPRGDVGGWMES